MAVVAIDPGETTGLVWIDDVERVLLGNVKWKHASENSKSGSSRIGRNVTGNGWLQIKEQTEHDSINKILRGIRRLDSRFGLEAVVIEAFQQKLMNRSLKSEVLAPVRINAALDYVLREEFLVADLREGSGMRIVYQTTSDKSRMKDERLKFYGMLFPGKRPDVIHARDAARHLLKYALDNHKKNKAKE